jgi:hypothetical protein
VKVNFAGAGFYTGRPESWCIKYTVNLKREANVGIPVHDVAKRKNVLLKRAT